MSTRLRTIPLALTAALALVTTAAAAPQDVPTLEEAQALLATDPLKAADAYRKICKAEPDNARAHHMVGYSLHMAGDLDAALEAHLAAAKFESVRPICLYNVACVFALKGEKDSAFDYLAKAYEAGFDNAEQLRDDGDMDGLRSDPRFTRFYARVSGGELDLAGTPPAHRLDFWIGSWDTAIGDEVYGASKVEKLFESGGVRQTAYDAATGEARSTSTYVWVPDRRVWKQVWIDGSGDHVVLEGGFEGGRLVMTMVAMNGEPTVTGRSVFSNLAHDGFDYQWQTTTDGGTTWEEGTQVRFARAKPQGSLR